MSDHSETRAEEVRRYMDIVKRWVEGGLKEGIEVESAKEAANESRVTLILRKTT